MPTPFVWLQLRRVFSDGTSSIVAGTLGVNGSSGSGVPGTAALLRYPRGLAAGPANASDVVIADSCVCSPRQCVEMSTYLQLISCFVLLRRSNSHAIRILYANGTISTLAGALGVSGTSNGPATAARFSQPFQVAPGSQEVSGCRRASSVHCICSFTLL